MSKNFTLHDLPKEERPRERLRKIGVDSLSIQELLALIIEKGKKGKNVLSIAQNLLAHFGNLAKIKEASIEELQKVKGIGFATSCKLKASFKLGEKVLSKHKRYGQKIETPEDIYNIFKNELGSKKKEHFRILSLNSRNRLININNVSIGILNASLAHPREIFSSAIKDSAFSIILVHNHPSGETKPSKEDIKITQKLIKAGKILDIKIIDHIIITSDSFASLKDRGDI